MAAFELIRKPPRYQRYVCCRCGKRFSLASLMVEHVLICGGKLPKRGKRYGVSGSLGLPEDRMLVVAGSWLYCPLHCGLFRIDKQTEHTIVLRCGCERVGGFPMVDMFRSNVVLR